MDMGALISQLDVQKQRAFVWLFINNQAEAMQAELAAPKGKSRDQLPLGEPRSTHEFAIFLRQLNKIDAFRKIAKVAVLADELAAFKMGFAIKDQEELKRQRALAKQFVQ